MQVNTISINKQNFSGLHINKNVPSYIREAIISNPVIKKAQKKYSIFFKIYDDNLHCMTCNPETDSLFGLWITAPHSVTIGHHWFRAAKTSKNSSPMGSILSQIENIKSSEFFEKLVGKPRTLKDKLVSLKESFKIAFPPAEDGIDYLKRIETKYIAPATKKWEQDNMPYTVK